MRISFVGPASPSRIADLIDCPSSTVPKGYGPTPVDDLARALVARGHHVHVITADPERTETWRGRGANLDVSVVPYRQRARDRLKDMFKQERLHLARELSRSSADVVHAHWTYEFAVAALRHDPNALVTAHDSPFTVVRYHRDLYRAAKFVLAAYVRTRARNLAVVSPYLSEKWRKQMMWHNDIHLLPNIAPEIELLEGSKRDANTVLFLGNDDRRKNCAALLEAWPTVVSKMPHARLRLAGRGLEAGSRLSRNYRLQNCTFLGALDRRQVADELARASVLAHPSLEEAHPVAVLEAMRAGAVVVGGANSGGVPWTLKEGRAGILCDVTTPTSIASAIIEAMTNCVRVHKIVATASESLERFKPEHIATLHEDVYRQVFQGRGK